MQKIARNPDDTKNPNLVGKPKKPISGVNVKPMANRGLRIISYHISYMIRTNVLEHTRHTSALTVAQKHNETFQRNSTELKS